MRRFINRHDPLAACAAIVLLAGALAVLAACNGGGAEKPEIQPNTVEVATLPSPGPIEPADDWVVIQAGRVESSSTGGTLDTCNPITGGELLYLPACMYIEKGDRIGFANYFNTEKGGQAVDVELSTEVFGVAKITLQYEETTILEVQATPKEPLATKIETPSKAHGGPVMIPKGNTGG